MDLLTILAILILLTILGGATGFIAGEVLYVIIVIAVIIFVLNLLGVAV